MLCSSALDSYRFSLMIRRLSRYTRTDTLFPNTTRFRSEGHVVPLPAAEFLPGVIEFSESRVGVFEMANARMSSDTERLDSRRQDRHLEGEDRKSTRLNSSH